MPLRRERDEAFEAGLADGDVAHRRGQHASVLDQEGFGGEAADRNPRGDADPGAVEHVVGDLGAGGAELETLAHELER